MEEMFRMVAIGDYDDRYVVPKRHGEVSPDAFAEQGSCGIDFVNGAPRRPSRPSTRTSTSGTTSSSATGKTVGSAEPVSPLKLASVLLQYPDAERREAAAARELEIALRGVTRWSACARSAAGTPRPRSPSSSASTSRRSTSGSSAATSPITSTATAASAAWRCSA